MGYRADFGAWRERRAEVLREAQEKALAREARRVRKAFGSGEVSVRWGLSADEPGVAELLELNGMPRWVAFEERFIVAEEDGRLLAALRYRTEAKRLLLGLLVVDPWTGERRLAIALYDGAYSLAREAGIGEVRARSNPHGDYPGEAGYRRGRGGWSSGEALSSGGGLPAGGWRRILALMGVAAAPFHRAFRG